MPLGPVSGKFWAVMVAGSMALEKSIYTAWLTVPITPPSMGDLAMMVGGTVSCTRFKTRGVLNATLPPVSVTRNWTVAVVGPDPILGALKPRLYGNDKPRFARRRR